MRERDKQGVRDRRDSQNDMSDPSRCSRKSRANNEIHLADLVNEAGRLFQQPARHRSSVGGRIRALRSVSR
jgi:hypothetical protein